MKIKEFIEQISAVKVLQKPQIAKFDLTICRAGFCIFYLTKSCCEIFVYALVLEFMNRKF